MAECIIREMVFLGEDKWHVDAIYTDESGTRVSGFTFEAPEEASEGFLKDMVIAVYTSG